MGTRALTEAQYQQRLENVAKIAATKRAKETCIRGHNNWRIKKDGCRVCRVCHRDRNWYGRRGLRYQ